MNNPLIAHIHVPKCSGTSFRFLLDNLFPGGHLHLYTDLVTKRDLATTFVWPDEQLAGLVRNAQVKAISSHFIRRFPECLGGRQMRYVTFLREPVSQFVSYLSYTRRYYHLVDEPVLLSHLPPHMQERSLRECAAWLMEQPIEIFLSFRENYTTNFFARHVAEFRCGYGYADQKYRETRLCLAKEVLSRFFLVGIAEAMEDSCVFLLRRLREAGLPVPSVTIGRANQAEKLGEDLSWLNEEDETGARVLASVAEDRQLYHWARNRFEKNCLASGLYVVPRFAPKVSGERVTLPGGTPNSRP